MFVYFQLDLLCNFVYNISARGKTVNPRNTAVKELKAHGYRFKRSGGKHDIYYNAERKHTIPLKRGHFDEADLRYICREISQGGRM